MNKIIYLQQHLFRSALDEHNIHNDFSCNHQLGTQKIGDLFFGLKFPMKYVNAMLELDHKKIYQYCFIGHINPKLGRDTMLEPFHGDNSYIKSSNYGRDPNSKFELTLDYYQYFANSKFGLCPNHQGGAWYIHDWAWSYRFVETIFCQSIPVVFRSTPYGKHFVKDCFYVWDDQSHQLENYSELVERNLDLARRYWTLQPEEIESIRNL